MSADDYARINALASETHGARPLIVSTFSGYGGLDLGVQQATGGRVVAHVEWEAAPSRILAHHWPEVPNLGDVTQVEWNRMPHGNRVILTTGFPCQDVSLAGLRRGLKAGTRSGLWSEVAKAIDEIRPGLVVIENVRGLLSAEATSPVEPDAWNLGDGRHGPTLRALGAVLGDLADLGYDARWCGLRAADAGAPHGRFRVFVIAYPAGQPWRPGTADADGDGRARVGRLESFERDAHGRGCPDPDGDGTEPAARLLPTPLTSDMRGVGEHGRGGNDLRTEIALLKTPTAQLAVNGGSQHPDKRKAGGHGPTLADEIEHLLPTPTVQNSHGNRENGRGEALLPGVAEVLLPTPTVGNATGGNATRSGDRSDELLLPGLAVEIAAQRATAGSAWGPFAEAIARWEAVTGRTAPPPTNPDGKHGSHRLAPQFSEWMMGLSAGHITNPTIWIGMKPSAARTAMLKAIGNGVVPQHAALAVRSLVTAEWGELRGAAA